MTILTPLFAVFGIMLLGTLVQKLRFLPVETDQVLNQYVYYIAFPAILLIALAQQPIEEILQWGFIAGYSAGMLVIYLVCIGISLLVNPKQSAIAAVRALNATFGNTAFIGIPLLVILFPQQQSALVAAAIASLLSVLMFAVALVSLELATNKQRQHHAAVIMLLAVVKNPIVIGCFIGVAISALGITLPAGLAMMIQQIGNTSSPCALFAVGMVLAKAMRYQKDSKVFSLTNFIELSLINLFKLILQPALVYFMLKGVGVTGDYLVMGVILSALPTAASVYLLAQRYNTQASTSAQGILFGTIVTFFSLPILEQIVKTYS
ncbi:Auxin Efflux Carrier [Shewanella sp. MR-4]|uniref:AEC family transporter n=1 Tax=Shewanella sp. (strain MR-4) TaxID=60480 RepID=UPI00005E4D36|nr:AEC family transporter [Shewanella sp. MR-4]ABI38185.1 Auxin Efflux Carrier [Shewanella sp. MR-4]